ncbi:serine palmitoyltransferase 1 [Aphelenchoides avenae]|nr:serine palmitoyltransferase 1 [Aphelenchus avenae]
MGDKEGLNIGISDFLGRGYKHPEPNRVIQADEDKPKEGLSCTSVRYCGRSGAKSADLCPLPKLIELKWKYKVRIFIDESYTPSVSSAKEDVVRA